MVALAPVEHYSDTETMQLVSAVAQGISIVAIRFPPTSPAVGRRFHGDDVACGARTDKDPGSDSGDRPCIRSHVPQSLSRRVRDMSGGRWPSRHSIAEPHDVAKVPADHDAACCKRGLGGSPSSALGSATPHPYSGCSGHTHPRSRLRRSREELPWRSGRPWGIRPQRPEM